MTTIATDGKSMAGDSLTTCSGYALATYQKIHRLPDGRIFGGSGPSVDARQFEGWMREGGDKPALSDEFCALVLNTDGTVDWFDKSFVPIRYLLPAAIGSGQELAQGAMLAGATPEEAVHIASRIDRKTGGEISVEYLKPSLEVAA